MDVRTEKAYSHKEMYTTLNIGDSTLRKWCIALEKNGYKFLRNEQDNRVYVEGDLVVLRHFYQLVKIHKTNLENAAKLIVARFGGGAFEVGTGIVPVENDDQVTFSKDGLKELIQEAVREEREEFKKLINQEREALLMKMNDTVEMQSRVLMKAVRDQQEETQKELAAEKEKKKWWKFGNR
jgi:hypothetical protein